MNYELAFTEPARNALKDLENDKGLLKQLKAVKKALGLLQTDPRHQGLNTHKLKGRVCPHNEPLFEAYAQNNTPGAFRIYWCYNNPKSTEDMPTPTPRLLIVSILAHE